MTLRGVLDVTSINARDSASGVAEHANAVAGTTVIGIPFNCFKHVTVNRNDNTGVAVTPAGAIDENHPGLDLTRIVQGLLRGEGDNAVTASAIPSVEHTTGLDRRILHTQVFRRFAEAPKNE